MYKLFEYIERNDILFIEYVPIPRDEVPRRCTVHHGTISIVLPLTIYQWFYTFLCTWLGMIDQFV